MVDLSSCHFSLIEDGRMPGFTGEIGVVLIQPSSLVRAEEVDA